MRDESHKNDGISDSGCNDSGVSIFTFTELQMLDIASNYQTTSYKLFQNDYDYFGAWNFRNSYKDDNTIHFWIDPELPEYLKQAILAELSKQSLLLGVTFAPESEQNGSVELNFTVQSEKDLKRDSTTAAVTKKDGIYFNPEAIDEKHAIRIVNHEMVHFFGVAHTSNSVDARLAELGVFFDASVVPRSITGTFEVLPEVISPLDIYMLSIQMKEELSFYEKVTGKSPSFRALEYLKYYESFNDSGEQYVVKPEIFVDSNGEKVSRITLPEWIVDREIAIFEMPGVNPDGTKNIAIVASEGFVVIEGMLGSTSSTKLDVVIKDINNGGLADAGGIGLSPGGSMDGQGVAQFSVNLNGFATMQSVKNGIDGALTSLFATELYSRIADSRIELDKGKIDSLNSFCSAANIEDAEQITSGSLPNRVLSGKAGTAAKLT